MKTLQPCTLYGGLFNQEKVHILPMSNIRVAENSNPIQLFAGPPA